ncbi:unnamed protein product [Penicillium olsonii]|nr:unnamed protein product [Penicillium olsonii]
MTVFIASLFLPYTIDFDIHMFKKKSRPLSSYAVDGSGAIHWEDLSADIPPNIMPRELPLTPGATIDNEKVFFEYTSRISDKPAYDRSPSEHRDVIWGCSQKFTQPRSLATETPTSSISNAPSQEGPAKNLSLDGSQDRMRGQLSQKLICSSSWRAKTTERGLGGLTNAIHAAEQKGILEDYLWVGTVGMPTDSLTKYTRGEIAEYLREEKKSLAVFVEDTEFEGHYTHFCHEVLWPALHYQMQESPRHSEFERYSWDQYVKLNEAFADTIVEHWKPGDEIWAHDYHLLILPGILRKRIPEAQIGFFLHTPFPSSEVFRCLSPRDQLLDGILGADLVGFQTEEYRNHFVQSCSRLRRLDTSVNQVTFNGRIVLAESVPMGIDPSLLNKSRNRTEVQGWISSISYRYPNQRLIVARDRLDVSGGIKQRLLAYERFLLRYPEWRNDVVLIQIISSAGAVSELEAQVSRIAMRINTTHSSPAHQTLVLLKQDIHTHQFIALLSIADIYMATGLREGINLTSHEFILCQDKCFGSIGYGSLIISEFVGSASILHKRNGATFQAHELLVNPWDFKQCAEAIHTALEMSPERRFTEWKHLFHLVSKFSAISWHEQLQVALQKSCVQSLRQVSDTSPLPIGVMNLLYHAIDTRLFFVEDADIYGPDPLVKGSSLSARAFKIFKNCFRESGDKIYLISNKTLHQLSEMFPELPPEIGIIVENGSFVRHPNTRYWVTVTYPCEEWLGSIRKMMEDCQERTEGSRVEVFPWSLIFHYDDASDHEAAARQASELAAQINGARGKASFQIIRNETSFTVELSSSEYGRGRAAQSILEGLTKAEFPKLVMVTGKSPDNEALFRWASDLTSASRPRQFRTPGIGAELWVETLATGPHARGAKSTLPDGFSFLRTMNWLLNGRSDEGVGN